MLKGASFTKKLDYFRGISRFYRKDNKEIQFSKGERCYVYDTEGNRYLDFVLGYGPVIIGHSNPEFIQLVNSYLNNGILMPGYTKWHEEYLDRFLGDLRDTFSAMFFKTASEAISGAIRLAAFATGKFGLIRCGYIGWHDALLGKTISWHEPLYSPIREQERFINGMRGIGPDEPVFNWVNLDLEELERILEKNAKKIGAFIIDLYQLSFSEISVLSQAIALCHDYGIIIILV